ncbi:hypothetical protein MTO96_020966 [Rhipicephalus appendiculatus]
MQNFEDDALSWSRVMHGSTRAAIHVVQHFVNTPGVACSDNADHYLYKTGTQGEEEALNICKTPAGHRVLAWKLNVECLGVFSLDGDINEEAFRLPELPRCEALLRSGSCDPSFLRDDEMGGVMRDAVDEHVEPRLEERDFVAEGDVDAVNIRDALALGVVPMERLK